MSLLDRLRRGGEGMVERLARRQGVHDYRSEVASIEEAPLPISAFAVLYVILALIAIAVVWSLFGTVDRIVVAQGKIVTTAPQIVMQPFTTSRILRLNVQAGDRVKKGQVLVTFDPAFARADQSSLSQKVAGLGAQLDRIKAELAHDKDFPVPPGSDPERLAQAKLFVQRNAQYSAEMTARQSRIQQVEAELVAARQNVTALTHELELANRVQSMWQRLEKANAATTIQIISAEKEAVDAEARLKTAVEDQHKLEQQSVEAKADRQSYLQQWQSDLGQKLVETRQQLSEASQELNKAQKLRELTELRAPIDAVVLQLADVSEGSVLREAETLITLVPADAPMRLDADIASRDVGFVKVGDSVRVKFEAYPFQRYGTLDGRLDVVSPDSLDVKNGEHTEVVFRAQVHVLETAGHIAERGIRLRPGLIATAEIKTGGRSIASYILDPIVQTTHEALREP